MKRLAIITTHPIQYQIPLFKKFKKKKIDAHVFFASKHGLVSKKKDHEFGVKFDWKISSNILSGYKSYFSSNQKHDISSFRLNFKGIGKRIKEGKFDAILILGWNNFHYLKAIYYAIKYKKTLILRSENNLYSNNSFLKNKIKYLILSFLFRKIDYFLSIGTLNKQFYLSYKINKNKILEAPYFVDNNFFKIKKKKKKIKKYLGLKEKKIILFVGKLIPRKRPLDFIKLAQLNKNNNNLLFLIIGDGKLRSKCLQYIKKNKLTNINFKGFVNQNNLKFYYKIADILIQTSSYETWGLTINESLASGTPVICTKDCGASHDLIKNKKSGKVYNTGNIGELNYKMKSLLMKNSKINRSYIEKAVSKNTVDKTINSIHKILYAK